VSFAAEAGQLQLNAFEPIIAHSLFKSLVHLTRGCDTLRERCVTGISANRERLAKMLENPTGDATALSPYIGYSSASEVAREALASGKTVYQVALEKKLLTREQLDEILRPHPHKLPHQP
jgi:aspartate ammonia-lyase